MATKTSSGIYAIVNLASGERYIGSAVSLDRRHIAHWAALAAGRHHNRRLQRSWNKYGSGCFAFRVLLLCEKQQLLFYEQMAITGLIPEYNLSPTAGSTLGVILSPQTRAKIAAKALGRERNRESVERGAAKLRGRKVPVEQCAHLLGNKHAVGSVHTEEWKRANSERHKGTTKPKSAAYRAKISATLKGIAHSAERRANQAIAQTGLKRRPYVIKPKSPEQMAKIAAAISARQLGKKRKPETVEKMRAAFRARRLSSEHKEKISAASKAMWAARREEIRTARAAALLKRQSDK